MTTETQHKWKVGDKVEVATKPAVMGPTVRDSAGGWGFAYNEWREATISSLGLPGRYAVQFSPGDAHWHFSEHEIREPRGCVVVRVELMNGKGEKQVKTVGGDTPDDAVRVAEEAANRFYGDWTMNEWEGVR